MSFMEIVLLTDKAGLRTLPLGMSLILVLFFNVSEYVPFLCV